MKEVLKEAYSYQKKHGVDPKNVRELATDNNKWEVYIESFVQTLPTEHQDGFRVLCENTRKRILESTIATLNPYETLMLPVLRNFYPRLIAKDLVTVKPIDKPDTILPYLNITFSKYGSSDSYTAPSIANDVSGGIAVSGDVDLPGTLDLLAAAGLTPNVAHLAKNVIITKATETTTSGSEEVDLNVTPTVDGTFAFNVKFPTSGNEYTVTGTIDFYNGKVTLSSDPAPGSGVTLTIRVTGSISAEENTINPTAEFSIDKLRLVVTDRKITGEWSVELEQDVKALFDIDFQAQLSQVIAEQIALDIDREIITTLKQIATSVANPTHRKSFDYNPPATYSWGPKMWHENILVPLDEVSAAIYSDTQIGPGNTIAANPMDAAILEHLNSYAYNENAQGGAVGYKTATIASGKWQVLVSSVVDLGQMIIVHKPTEDLKCIFIYAPYQPVILMPYPLGSKPTITVMSRYASLTVRPQGIGKIEIVR